VIHIPTAFYVLGVLGALYTLACVLYAKAKDSRMGSARPRPKLHSMRFLERLTNRWRAR